MEFKKFARKHFFLEVAQNKEISSELRHKLLREDHPRINIMLDNTGRELLTIQQRRVQKGIKPASHENLAWVVREMAKVFIHTLELDAKQVYETEAAKALAKQKAQDEADMQATLEGKPQGAFEEMGLVISDRSQAAQT